MRIGDLCGMQLRKAFFDSAGALYDRMPTVSKYLEILENSSLSIRGANLSETSLYALETTLKQTVDEEFSFLDSEFSIRSRANGLCEKLEHLRGLPQPQREWKYACYCCKRESLRRKALGVSRDKRSQDLCVRARSIDVVQNDLLSRHIWGDVQNQASRVGWGITETLFRRLITQWSEDSSDPNQLTWQKHFVDLFPAYAPVQSLLNPVDYDDLNLGFRSIMHIELQGLSTSGWVLHDRPSLKQDDQPIIKPEPEEMKYFSVEGSNEDQTPQMPMYSPELRYGLTRANHDHNAPRSTNELISTSFHQLRSTDEIMADVHPRHTDKLEERPAFRGPSIEAGQGMLPRPRNMHHFEFVTYY
jgi:hypothetical protein